MKNLALFTLLAMSASSVFASDLDVLMGLKCSSSINGKVTNRVSSTRTANRDGYTTSMKLTLNHVVNSTRLTGRYNVTNVSLDDAGILSVDAVSLDTKSAVTILVNTEDSLSTMTIKKLNGKPVKIDDAYQKFTCRAPVAG